MGKKILVVDDNLDDIKWLGCCCKRAAMTSLRRNPAPRRWPKPSPKTRLMILGITMPDMDGYEVCRQLRADPPWQTCPSWCSPPNQGRLTKWPRSRPGRRFPHQAYSPDELISRVETALMPRAQSGK